MMSQIPHKKALLLTVLLSRIAVFIAIASIVSDESILCAQYAAPAPNETGNSAANDNFAGISPVLSFVESSTGQPYGRYIVPETVTVPKYQYQPVKTRVWQPTWVTESKTSTQTQYTPVYAYQLQLKNVSSWNPFEPPRQAWEYVPVVQYQTNYVPVTQPITYQKYEEKEVTQMIPVLVSASEQRPKFADRPLGTTTNGGNVVAINNVAEQAALIAQANRNTSRLPTRSIDYPNNSAYGNPALYGYGVPGNQMVAAPPAYVLNNSQPTYSHPLLTPPSNGGSYAGQPQTAVAASKTTIPMVAVNPQYYGPSGYANTAPMGTQFPPGYQNVTAQPYASPQQYYQTASQPSPNSSWYSSTTPLFSKGLFSSKPSSTNTATNPNSANYVASTMSTNGFYPSNSWYSSLWGYGAPNSYGYPPPGSQAYPPNQSAWGMSPANPYRDPSQSGIPPTVMR